MYRKITLFYFVLTAFVFTNAQAPLNLPYFTGFDSPSQKAGWKEYRKGFLSTSKWNNNGALSHDYNVGGNTGDTVIDWYVSPAFNFKSKGKITFKVSAGGFSNAIDDNLLVYVSTTKSDPALGNYTLIGNLSFIEKGKQIDTLLNINSIADSGFIAFRYKTIGAAWWVPVIDSITVSAGAPASVKKETHELKNSISVYPNPVNDILSFDFNEQFKNETLSLKVYNICGQTLVQTVINNKQSIKIDLPANTYFYTLENKAGRTIQTGKLFVVN